MRDTGIVRRIDDLGRVVIPKEIRKTLRIKEGDPLEIYTNKDELTLKKYSPFSTDDAEMKSVCDALSAISGKICIATDKDAVKYVTSSKYKELTGKNLFKDLDDIISDGRSVINCRADGKPLKLFVGEDETFENVIVAPIVADSDRLGALILCDKNSSERFTSADEKNVVLCAAVLSGLYA